MTTKRCACCGKPFQPRPQVPNQAYCSSPECQRARKRHWQQDKLQNDPDYRGNQRDAQRAWQERNPDYWRSYRDTHPEYAERNRNRQRPKQSNPQRAELAKMDVSGLQSGLYQPYPAAFVQKRKNSRSSPTSTQLRLPPPLSPEFSYAPPRAWYHLYQPHWLAATCFQFCVGLFGS